MIYFIKGFIIEITKWNLRNNRSKTQHVTKFVPENEVTEFKDFLKLNDYISPNSSLFYKLDDAFLEVIQFKGSMPKSYIYKDLKVVFWSREIDIIKVTSANIDDYLEKIVVEADEGGEAKS